ncbi:MAG: PDZ domain-containing protein [Gemmatimonadaceae bacterium]|nr:PDZ domain-containing protein [Gemmatimonadaceae bacterium]
MRRIAPGAVMASALMGAAIGVVGAQQPAPAPRASRHVTVRVDTSDAMKVTVVLQGLDSLMRSLAESRILEERIGMALREYGASQANADRRRALADQLQRLAERNVQLMSKIQMACSNQKASEFAPEGYLGVTFNMSGGVKRELSGPEIYHFDEPPEIISVESGSPADRARIRRGDRIVALDGRELVGRDVILAQYFVPGRKLPVRISRDGSEQNVIVLVQKRPAGFGDQCTDLDLWLAPVRVPGQALHAPDGKTFTFVRPPAPPRTAKAPSAPAAPAPPGVWSPDAPPPVAISGFSSIVAGAQLTTLTDDFKEVLGTDAGVLVQRVVLKSPAALAGLKGGDVIVEAADRPVTSAWMLQRMIGDSEQRALKLKVVRKGKARTVWLKW